MNTSELILYSFPDPVCAAAAARIFTALGIAGRAVNADEVTQSTWIRYPGSDSFRMGGEIAKDNEGRFEFNRHTVSYNYHHIIGQSDIEWQRQYRNDDANWSVPKKA